MDGWTSVCVQLITVSFFASEAFCFFLHGEGARVNFEEKQPPGVFEKSDCAVTESLSGKSLRKAF